MKPRHETECHVCERRLVFHANIQVRVWLRTFWSRRLLLLDLFFAILHHAFAYCAIEWNRLHQLFAMSFNLKCYVIEGSLYKIASVAIGVSLGYSLPLCLHLAAVKVRCKATMGIWPCILGHKSKSIGSRFEKTMTKRLGQSRAHCVVIVNQLAPEIIVTKMRVIFGYALSVLIMYYVF